MIKSQKGALILEKKSFLLDGFRSVASDVNKFWIYDCMLYFSSTNPLTEKVTIFRDHFEPHSGLL